MTVRDTRAVKKEGGREDEVNKKGLRLQKRGIIKASNLIF